MRILKLKIIFFFLFFSFPVEFFGLFSCFWSSSHTHHGTLSSFSNAVHGLLDAVFVPLHIFPLHKTLQLRNFQSKRNMVLISPQTTYFPWIYLLAFWTLVNLEHAPNTAARSSAASQLWVQRTTSSCSVCTHDPTVLPGVPKSCIGKQVGKWVSVPLCFSSSCGFSGLTLWVCPPSILPYPWSAWHGPLKYEYGNVPVDPNSFCSPELPASDSAQRRPWRWLKGWNPLLWGKAEGAGVV